jgi:YD repeat-containing protein
MAYEPVFNQTVRVRSGITDQSGLDHVHYETLASLCPNVTPDDDLNNPCAAVRPLSTVMSDPSTLTEARRIEFTWAPHGQMASLNENGGPATTFYYYRTPGYPDTVPAVSTTNRGMLARISNARIDANYSAPQEGIANPCPLLRGPYQWLLGPSCHDPAQELSTLGISPRAVSAIIAANGQATIDQQFAYSSIGGLSQIQEAGNTIAIRTDTDGRVVSRLGPGNLRFEFIYTGDGLINEMRRLDPLNNVVGRKLILYDREGRVTDRQENLRVDRAPRIHYMYSPGGRLISVTNPMGAVTELSYDLLGQLIERRRRLSQTMPVDRSIRYRYTDDGDPKYVGFGLDQTRGTLGAIDLFYDYDGFRRLSVFTDEHKRRWSYLYNERSQLQNSRQLYTNLQDIEAAKIAGHPLVWETVYTYDSHGRVKVRNDNGLATATFTYTNDGRLVRQGSAGFGDTIYSYGRTGQQLWSRDAAGNQVAVTYDPATLTHTLTRLDIGPDSSPFTTTTEKVYDPRGMLASRVTRPRFGQGRSEQWSYADDGRMYRFTDPIGVIREYSFDYTELPEAAGIPRLSSSSSNNPATTYDYSDLELNTSVVDPNNQTTTTSYNTYGEISSRHAPGFDAPIQFQYDGYGRLETVTLPDAQRIRYKYDVRNYLEEERLVQPQAEVPLRSWQYDERGRPIQIVESNRITAAQSPNPVSTLIEYDSNGRVRAETTKIGNRSLSEFRLDSSGEQSMAATLGLSVRDQLAFELE